jgi:hypothetical protein
VGIFTTERFAGFLRTSFLAFRTIEGVNRNVPRLYGAVRRRPSDPSTNIFLRISMDRVG